MKMIQDEDCQPAFFEVDQRQLRQLKRLMGQHQQQARTSLDWLIHNMPPYFFITMRQEQEALVKLAVNLHDVTEHRKVTLVDHPDKLILARRDQPGSVYDTLREIQDRQISYSEMTHSLSPLPGGQESLEVFRFEFGALTPEQVAQAQAPTLPRGLVKQVRQALARHYPDSAAGDLGRKLRLVGLSSPTYIQVSPALRLARLLWLYQKCRRHDGLFLELEEMNCGQRALESRLMFAVGNPSQGGFMAQVLEVFDRLEIGVRRLYALDLYTQVHPFFLGTFYVHPREGGVLREDSQLYRQLQAELYNTQILSNRGPAYQVFLQKRLMTGQEASLANTLVEFCHTTLAHAQPDRFDRTTVRSAFFDNPEMCLRLIDLFKLRFEPERDRSAFQSQLDELTRAVEEFNTGFRRLDRIRRTIYATALLFIRYCLKTNFFVPRKHALAFRLDPAYLEELDPEFTADLPPARPFRITFFFSRHGAGYHIGFSDIARGGWRTVICRNQDQYLNTSNFLFREVFVLAHTQHLKNKDIYEGGSKMGVFLDARDLDTREAVTQRLYKLQFGFINAFLDIFVTRQGRAADSRVVDYYGDDEPIELGPDENMHDAMIEFIAQQAEKRGYLLGVGIMSSKSFGINHKDYGVTSRGVIRTAEIALARLGLDMHRDQFTVRFTGGPRGDVAGNAMKLILERCPGARILCLIDGSGGVFDPQGLDGAELERHLLVHSAEAFDPQALHPGGYILYRNQRRRQALRDLYRRLGRGEQGVEETWLTIDEFQNEMDHLLFKVQSDLFLPCGGRPETIDQANWQELLDDQGKPRVRVIVEGANSFITPPARLGLQEAGVILIRDASANKCGVISSSYEIMANLLMSRREFLRHKEAYVADVLDILDQRAAEETKLIFARFDQAQGAKPYTEISQELSREINHHYARLFQYFQENPDLADLPAYRRVILAHLPRLIAGNPRLRSRIRRLPPKIKYAVLAVEIATTIVYRGGWETDLGSRLSRYVKEMF